MNKLFIVLVFGLILTVGILLVNLISWQGEHYNHVVQNYPLGTVVKLKSSYYKFYRNKIFKVTGCSANPFASSVNVIATDGSVRLYLVNTSDLEIIDEQ